MLFLVADIGGTNARFALVRDGQVREDLVLACADYPDIVSAAQSYLARVDASAPGARPEAAALAIAGPLTGDQISMTNHAWSFSAAAVRRALGLKQLIMLNDFTALAMSLPYLPDADLQQCGGERPAPAGARALIGPGTGLGVSGLLQHAGQWLPIQGEGGHVALAPCDDFEGSILSWLWQRQAHVSAENLLSGPGLQLLYGAICALTDARAQDLSPAQITARGLEGSSAECRRTLETFCRLLGTVAGNLALTLGAVGGLYIGGGIVPRLGEFFLRSGFRARFDSAGHHRAYLTAIPAWVIHTEFPALLGAARAFQDPGPRLVAG